METLSHACYFILAAIILDTLKTQNFNFQDIRLYGLNTLNVFFRENQQNPEAQPMVFNMVSSMLKMYFDENAARNINQKYVYRCIYLIFGLSHVCNNIINRLSHAWHETVFSVFCWICCISLKTL